MGQKLKVFVASATGDNWYKVGDTYEVHPVSTHNIEGVEYDRPSYALISDPRICIAEEDCVVIQTSFKDCEGNTYYDEKGVILHFAHRDIKRIAEEELNTWPVKIGSTLSRSMTVSQLALFIVEYSDDIREILKRLD